MSVIFSFFCGIVIVLADDKEKNKAEILLLSIAANVVSRHTSMVGVDKDRKKKIVGSMIQRDVPLMTSRMYARSVPAMASRLSACDDFSSMAVSNCAQRSEELFSKILVISRVKISGDWIPGKQGIPLETHGKKLGGRVSSLPHPFPSQTVHVSGF